LGEYAASTDVAAKPAEPSISRRRRPEPVGEAAHRHQQPGEYERVDVDDPQQSRAARLQRG
jgi:hypothetical protein